MRRTSLATFVALALPFAVPSPARAAVPEVQGRVAGMSELPAPVQDAVAREASRTDREIGELRVEPHGQFRAELLKDGHGEVATFDHTGRLIDRRDY